MNKLKTVDSKVLSILKECPETRFDDMKLKLYDLTEAEDCPFVLWIGSRRLIKRKTFDEYIEKMYSI